MISKSFFGKTSDGIDVDLYSLKGENGFEVKIITYGAAIQSLITPDKDGRLTDVLLGCETVAAYEAQDKFFGAVIGRCANRIAKGEFTLNGKEYKLFCNDGKNHLHGGKKGFDKRVWQAETDGETLRLTLISEDGEEGYPGRAEITAEYSVKGNALLLNLYAVSDKDTVVNLTNHAYFNLNGHDGGSILKHKLKLCADSFTVGGEGLIPTGEIAKVEGTPMDFRDFKVVGDMLDEEYESIKVGGGYDNNYVLNDYDGTLKTAAVAVADNTGILMEIKTDLPGIQFYSGNFLKEDTDGKNGAHYAKRGGFCLEPQFFPNAVNEEAFLKPLLKAGEKYAKKIEFVFSTK